MATLAAFDEGSVLDMVEIEFLGDAGTRKCGCPCAVPGDGGENFGVKGVCGVAEG